jgi:replicative DNA helicase
MYLCAESPENYSKYRHYVKDHVVQPETVLILDKMGDYYTSYPSSTSVDWEAFSSFLLATYAIRLSPDKISMLRGTIVKMQTFTPTIAYEQVIKTLIEMDSLALIAEECLKAREGTSDLEAINELTVKALKDVERFIDKKDLFVVPDISGVVDRILSTGYQWRLMSLNRSLGLVRSGDFIIIAARVEVGKTTFLASEVSFIAPQLPKDRPVVWVNNEEKSDSVFFRVVQATLGKTTKEIMADHTTAMKDYTAAMGGDKNRILITDGHTNNVKTLDTLFKDVKPGMIIFDVLDKVDGFKNDEREDIRLGKLYKWARDWARQDCVVIAASQLSGEAEMHKDPPYIGMDSLRGSKTDKPGEADAIITLGKYKEPANDDEAMMRTINVPKNKLPGGGTHQVESERHGKYLVRIDPLRARYE